MRHTRVERAENKSESGRAVSLSTMVIGPSRWADLAGRTVGVSRESASAHSLLFRKIVRQVSFFHPSPNSVQKEKGHPEMPLMIWRVI
jgi:hypothetical protein